MKTEVERNKVKQLLYSLERIYELPPIPYSAHLPSCTCPTYQLTDLSNVKLRCVVREAWQAAE